MFNVQPGEYIYFHVEIKIIQNLSLISIASIVNQLELDFKVDGYSLDKCNSIQI